MHKPLKNKVLLIAALLFFMPGKGILFAKSSTEVAEILVITNRPSASADSIYPFFNSVDESGSLKYLRVNKSSDKNLSVLKLDSVEFFKEIVDTPKNWVLFVHGDSKTFEQAVERGLKIQKLHDVRVIVFSWSSKDTEINGLRNLYTSQDNVVKSISHFNSVICSIKQLREEHQEFWDDHKLSLFLHSLGNYYLQKMVELGWLPVEPSPIFDNIIINAAAVHQRNHKEWVEQLMCASNIFIVSNRHDVNLKGARIFTPAGRQLGEDVRLPLADNAIYINFSRSVGFRFPTFDTHTYFINTIPLKSENIRYFYSEILNGFIPDFYDFSRFTKRRDGLGYDINF